MRVLTTRFSRVLSPAALLVVALAPAVAGQPPQQDSRDWEVSVSVCGVSFKTTRDWILSPESKGQFRGCEAQLRARNYDRLVGPSVPVHYWTIGIEVESKPFSQVVDANDIRHEGDRWFVGQGAFEKPAYEIKGPGWWGLRVDHFPIRSSSREISSFASETTWIVAASDDGSRTAFFYGARGADDQALPLLLNSLKFGSSKVASR